MNRWLIKCDPDDYSAADLARDKQTHWTGVRNPQAQQHLRSMAANDTALIYHTGKEKAAVATAVIVSAPNPDPTDIAGKAVAVQVRFDAWLARPVTLAELKAETESFTDFALLKISRLSVMPVRPAEWKRLLQLAGGLRH